MKTIIVIGNLGSGKTTNIRGLLKNKNYSLIINEMSELGLDAEIIKKSCDKSKIKQISGGCVCCTKSDELMSAINNIDKTDYLIIETSGITSLEQLIKQISRTKKEINGIIVIIDSLSASKIKYFSKETKNQILLSSTIILTKTDLISYENVLKIKDKIIKINPEAKIIISIKGNISFEDLNFFNKPLYFKQERTSLKEQLIKNLFPEINNNHIGVKSIIFKTNKTISKTKLIKFLKNERKIIRAKGFVVFKNRERYLFNYSSRKIDFEKFPGTGTYLVVIGRFNIFNEIIIKKNLELITQT